MNHLTNPLHCRDESTLDFRALRPTCVLFHLGHTQQIVALPVVTARPPDLLIDLDEVKRLSSSALGKFMRLYKRAQAISGRVRLCSIRPDVRDAFTITGFDRKFEIYPDADEALRHG